MRVRDGVGLGETIALRLGVGVGVSETQPASAAYTAPVISCVDSVPFLSLSAAGQLIVTGRSTPSVTAVTSSSIVTLSR